MYFRKKSIPYDSPYNWMNCLNTFEKVSSLRGGKKNLFHTLYLTNCKNKAQTILKSQPKLKHSRSKRGATINKQDETINKLKPTHSMVAFSA